MAGTDKKFDPIECTMSLGDHLEELRARLILALLGLLAGTIVCLFFGKRIIRFIESPYISVMTARLERLERNRPAEPNTPDRTEAFLVNLLEALEEDPNAPAIDPNVVRFVQKVYTDTPSTAVDDPNRPKKKITMRELDPQYRLVTLAPADSFVAYMKISIIAGLILSSPWVFYQLWMFIAAGLYKNERHYVRSAVPFSVALFIAGALFFLLVVAPISLRFFLGFGDLIAVSSSWTLQKYVSFVTILMLVFGVAFQTPIAIFILTRTGLVSVRALRRSRRYVLLGVFVVAAMTTPPDVISQITLAVPLYLLFELGIVLSVFAGKKRAAEQAQKQR